MWIVTSLDTLTFFLTESKLSIDSRTMPQATFNNRGISTYKLHIINMQQYYLLEYIESMEEEWSCLWCIRVQDVARENFVVIKFGIYKISEGIATESYEEWNSFEVYRSPMQLIEVIYLYLGTPKKNKFKLGWRCLDSFVCLAPLSRATNGNIVSIPGRIPLAQKPRYDFVGGPIKVS